MEWDFLVVFKHRCDAAIREIKSASVIYARAIYITLFKSCHDPQSLCISFESTKLAHAFVQRVFAIVSERWVADIMGKRSQFNKICIYLLIGQRSTLV
ncbi:hypothetical protein WS52_05495 [Burkholderia territorii]|nr:hypothetical protein WS52_05495 [Burkholderia territorii]KUZ53336.1 hypothetical protein WS53_17160 [Burkholderia territorii]